MDPKDDQAIRAVVGQWQASWNAGDMQAAAELFCDDADFVNVAGTHWHGRDRIRSEHVRLHQQHLKGSVFAPLEVGDGSTAHWFDSQQREAYPLARVGPVRHAASGWSEELSPLKAPGPGS